MMQSAQTRHRDYRSIRRWLWRDRPAGRRIFVQAIVNSIFVVVVYVIANQPTEMAFVQGDDVVENLSPATSHPSFRRAILPGRLYACTPGLQAGGLQEGDYFLTERRISIEDSISIRTRFGESLAQLLDHPLRCRVVSHVEVQNPTAPMLDHEKAIEQLECHGRYREEVERGDHFAMILEERKPAPARVAPAANAS